MTFIARPTGTVESDRGSAWENGSQSRSRPYSMELGERGPTSTMTGELVAGPDTLDPEDLAKNRVELRDAVSAHRLDDEYYRSRLPAFDQINVPVLSAGNWGGVGLHLRGNIEGYLEAGTSQKWLEIHGNSHFSPFYVDEGVQLQKRFLGHFLKGEDTGWVDQPPVDLSIRYPGERFVRRGESEWPIARTEWTRFYLDPTDRSLSSSPKAGAPISYRSDGEGVTFLTSPFDQETEITGPIAAKIFLSSETSDADIFLAVRLFDTAGIEVTFIGANDPAVPITLGWLRASHRKLDSARSLPYRPYHSHDEVWPLEPGAVAELDVEIWPTSIVIPRGFRLGLTVKGKDYENAPHYTPRSAEKLIGVSPFVHNDKTDRPDDMFKTTNTLHFADDSPSYLLLPIIPGRGEGTFDWFAHLRGDDAGGEEGGSANA